MDVGIVDGIDQPVLDHFPFRGVFYVRSFCTGQRTGSNDFKAGDRPTRQRPIVDRKGAHGQEVDGRATDRQLQRSDRQARQQATAKRLPAFAFELIRL